MKRALLGLVAVFSLAACSDDPTGSTGDPLTREEAMAIADLASQAGVGAIEGIDSNNGQVTVNGDIVASAAAAVDTFTLSFESSHPCPTSGRIQAAVTASLIRDPAAGSFDADVSASLTHDACAFRKDTVTVTVTGELTYEAHAQAEDHRPVGSWSSEAGGAVDWTTSDGRSGRCVVDISDVTDFAARTRTVQGEVCGHTINSTFTWSRRT